MANGWKHWPWIIGKLRQWIVPIFCLSVVLPVSPRSWSQNRPYVPLSQQLRPQFSLQRLQPQDEESLRIEKENARRANEQRQLELKRDTERLLQLTNELKQYVDASNENILSLDVIKKAEEIEKLAKSVKEKMKGHY
jgi:hypothetical protein